MLAVAAGIAFALTACQPATPVTTPKPATAQIEPAPLLPVFLAGVYGPRASLDEPWADAPDGQRKAGETIERSVCANERVEVAGAPHLLLAVCGVDPEAGHASTGLIDFFVLKPRGAQWQVAASARDLGFGSSGQPGEVSVHRLGRNFHGFRVEGAWVGQGYVLGAQTLVVPKGNAMVEAGTVRSSISNEGALDCELDRACDSRRIALSFDLQPDANDAAAKVYPLVVIEHGRECGSDVRREHRLAFDPATWHYLVPEALMREGCLSDEPSAGERDR